MGFETNGSHTVAGTIRAIRAAADPIVSSQLAGLEYVTGEGPGILRKRRGKGFYYVRGNSEVKDRATLKRIRSLVIPPAWTDVWICPSPRGHIQAVGRDARRRKQYRYHPDYREVRDELKFGRMLAFGQVLPKIREQVNRDLSLPGLPHRKVVAAIVRLLDETCVRVGNEEYAKQNKSFGLTTLRDRHASVRHGCVHLHFTGKSHQEHDIMLRDPRLARIVKRCQDLPGQDLFQYESDDGKPARLTSADVNEYLREITQQDFSAKDFRTWHGTCHMARQLGICGHAKAGAQAKKIVVEAVKETAKHLGNRPAACRKYYIHPAVFESFEDSSIFSLLPPTLDESRPSGAGLRPIEKAVVRLVKGYEARQKKLATAG